MATSTNAYEPYDGLTIDGSFIEPQLQFNNDFTKLAANILQFYLIVWDPDDTNEYKRDLGLSNKKYKEKLVEAGWRFEVISSNNTPATALVAHNKDNIIVTFRGSGVQKEVGETKKYEAIGETIKNILTDLNILLVEDERFPGKVHKGFLKEYLEIRMKIFDKVASLIPVSDRGAVRKRNLFISGFSLGSGMATLCLWDLPKQLNNKKLTIDTYGYLFACPAAGDHNFESALHNYNKNIFHIMHERDVVGQIPHSLFKNYRASARKLFVFDTNPLKTDAKSPETVVQLDHEKMDINLKIKRILPASVIADVLYNRLWAYLVVKLTKDVLMPFARYHNGYFYKNCMTEMTKDFSDKVSGSNLLETGNKQYELCQQHGI